MFEYVKYWIPSILCKWLCFFIFLFAVSALSPPSDVTVTNVTYTEISVEWSNVTVTGERIQYKASIDQEAGSLALLVGRKHLTHSRGLTQGNNYTINVRTSLIDSDDYDSEYATVIAITGKRFRTAAQSIFIQPNGIPISDHKKVFRD